MKTQAPISTMPSSVLSSPNDGTEEGTCYECRIAGGEDVGAWQTALDIFLNDDKIKIKEEFMALVYDVRPDDNGVLFSIDKVEPTNTDDPQSDKYLNKKEVREDVRIHSDSLILVEPHGGYRAVTPAGLMTYIGPLEQPQVFRFFTVDGEYRLMVELMTA